MPRRRETETPDYAAMLERMMRRYARRVADGDPVDLARMLELRRGFDQLVVEATRGMHEAGFSFAEIAADCGVSRQAIAKVVARG